MAVSEIVTDFFINTSKEKSLSELSEEILQMDEREVQTNFAHFSMSAIVAYLKENHLNYLNKKLPEVEQSMAHVFGGKEETSPLINQLVLFFGFYKKQLVAHIKMEEEVFFPMVEKLDKGTELKNSEKWEAFMEFMGNHDSVEDDLKGVNMLIKETVSGASVPLSFSVFMNQIDLFEKDLRQHALIEDMVLQPRVEALLKQ